MRSEKREKKERVSFGDIFPKYRISMLDSGRTKKVRVEGSKKLLLCLEKEVKISLGEETLHIYGDELSCVNYTGGAVEISGKIRDLSFESREHREEKR